MKTRFRVIFLLTPLLLTVVSCGQPPIKMKTKTIESLSAAEDTKSSLQDAVGLSDNQSSEELVQSNFGIFTHLMWRERLEQSSDTLVTAIIAGNVHAFTAGIGQRSLNDIEYSVTVGESSANISEIALAYGRQDIFKLLVDRGIDLKERSDLLMGYALFGKCYDSIVIILDSRDPDEELSWYKTRVSLVQAIELGDARGFQVIYNHEKARSLKNWPLGKMMSVHPGVNNDLFRYAMSNRKTDIFDFLIAQISEPEGFSGEDASYRDDWIESLFHRVCERSETVHFFEAVTTVYLERRTKRMSEMSELQLANLADSENDAVEGQYISDNPILKATLLEVLSTSVD